MQQTGIAELSMVRKHTRTVQIDEMRGFAILLVVLFHAVGSETGLATSFLGELNERLAFVRMPLFIAITGYLYGLERRTRPLNLFGWYKRSSRIFPPFILVIVICWIISTNSDAPFILINGLIFGAWHLWYLQALMVILLIVAMLEGFVKPNRNWHLPLWAIAAFLLSAYGLLNETLWLSIHKAIYLLPYFLVGATVGAMPGILQSSGFRYFVYICGLTALALNEVSLAGAGIIWTDVSLVAAAIGVASFLTLAMHMPTITTFRRLGAYSLPIFLWHLPLSAVTSFLMLNPMGIVGHPSVLAKILVGFTVPIAMSMMAARFAPALLVFVGKRVNSQTAIPFQSPLPTIDKAVLVNSSISPS